ncbi:MATE family efflux transporter [Levilactobacillus bambusae]|uniref:MATE family efflux transporter n=1 Tax=Levilactobacillus bambusae TaxID=2024736 RepID=A0A2V1MZQ6_9LACO|nr:MATE family efflux transporter [Levilactobacillus bambusae]PWG00302.1 MATE family efflux transporter [Levilactobacillus bambusae]
MKSVDLGKDQVLPLVLKLALPTMLAQFVNVLYTIVDRMFIGHIPGIGTLSLAGVGVCGPIISVLYAFAYLVGQGGTPLMAMQMGAGNLKSAKEILSNCFRILLVLGLSLTILFLIFRKRFLWWFGVSSATYPYALSFLTIYIYGTVFALISGGLNSFLIAQGHSGLGVTTVLIGALLNVSLDPILIFVCHLGVAGAAYSTIFSQIISALFALFCLCFWDLPVNLTWGHFRPDLCIKIIGLGLAPFLTYALDSCLLILLNTTLQRTGGVGLGDRLVTTATIIQSYLLLVTSPLSGITLGCQGIVSFNFGAKDFKRVKNALWCVYLVCLSFCSIIFLITIFASPYFVRLFTNDSPLITQTVTALKIYLAAVLCMAAQWTVTDMGIAMGQMKMALFCSLLRKALYIAGVLILPFLFTPQAAFFAQPLCDGVTSIISIIIFFRILSKILVPNQEIEQT